MARNTPGESPSEESGQSSVAPAVSRAADDIDAVLQPTDRDTRERKHAELMRPKQEQMLRAFASHPELLRDLRFVDKYFAREFLRAAFEDLPAGASIYYTLHTPNHSKARSFRVWSKEPPISGSGHPDWSPVTGLIEAADSSGTRTEVDDRDLYKLRKDLETAGAVVQEKLIKADRKGGYCDGFTVVTISKP